MHDWLFINKGKQVHDSAFDAIQTFDFSHRLLFLNITYLSRYVIDLLYCKYTIIKVLHFYSVTQSYIKLFYKIVQYKSNISTVLEGYEFFSGIITVTWKINKLKTCRYKFIIFIHRPNALKYFQNANLYTD